MADKLTRTTRRSLVAATAAAATSLTSITLAQATPEAPKMADFLFVQSAKGMTFEKARNALTLTGVSPVTIFFTDRPERLAGNMKTTRFIPFWNEGKGQLQVQPAQC